MAGMVPIPIPREIAMPVGVGAYTDIVGIDAPSSAVPATIVSITVRIKNLYSSIIGIMAGGALEYGVTPWPIIDFLEPIKNVSAGATESFLGTFVMPSQNVRIHAYSYYYTEAGWYWDDEETVGIVVAEIVFSNLSVVYSKG